MPRPADDMVVVDAGPFRMGVDGEGNESPQHVVNLDAFSIDRHEVTVGEWRASPLRLPEQPTWNAGDDQPVLDVTWHEAAEYCEWRGKRLPTEAEWEKAARGTDARAYPWGSDWDGGRANSGVPGDPFETAAPVGSMPDGAAPSGALDMAGNAWEWTADWYDPQAYADTHEHDPDGPERGSHKVARGGSFRSPLSVDVRTTVRLPVQPSARRDDLGLRCAR
jgi:formylglycine-generating enzyme required for sulfatase activity